MFYIGAMFFESDFKRSSSFTNVNIWQEHGIEYTPLYNLGLIGSFKESIIFLMVFGGFTETFFLCWQSGGTPLTSRVSIGQETTNQGHLSHQNHSGIAPGLDRTNP